MTIREFVWPRNRVEHIARHGVDPREVQEVCFGHPFVQRARSEGENPVYYIHWTDRLRQASVLRRHSIAGREGISDHRETHDSQ